MFNGSVSLPSISVQPDQKQSYLSQFKIINKLGEGDNSHVFLVEKKGQLLALKILPRDKLHKTTNLFFLESELRVLQTTSHPNVLKLYSVFFDVESIYVVSEYCENGNLLDFMGRAGSLDTKEVLRIVLQILSGLEYLHSKNIVHLDIKPENIFLDQKFNVRIGDFGFSRALLTKKQIKFSCGSLCYLSPEVILNKEVDPKKSDLWGAGLILYQLINQRLPWRVTDDDNLIIQDILHDDPWLPLFIPHPLQKIISQMLSKDSTLRPTATEAINTLHAYFHTRFASSLPQIITRSPSGKLSSKQIVVRSSAGNRLNHIRSSMNPSFARLPTISYSHSV